MPLITSTDLRVFLSLSVSSTPTTNGGRKGYAEAITGLSGNIFPDVPQSERITGSTVFRKAFYANTNATNAPLLNSFIFLDNYTAGDDAVYMLAGTQTNMQSNLTGSEQLYSCGKLQTNVTAGGTQIKVTVEDPTVISFVDTMKIRITDRANPASAGNDEYLTITGTPTISGTTVTMNVTSPLVNSYLAAAARVSGVIVIGTVVGAYSGMTASSVGGGNYTASGNLVVGNVGGVQDTWTLTFTSSTTFTCTGTAEGTQITGSTLSTYSPVNANTGTSYFDLGSAGWSGVWATNDTLVFTTSPSAYPVFLKRVVPAGAAAISGNKFTIAIDGETS